MDKLNRRRFNSSMNYSEYRDLYQEAPPKPVFGYISKFDTRPFQISPTNIPELSLDDYDESSPGELVQTVIKQDNKVRDKIELIYRPKVIIFEGDELESVVESHNSKSKKDEQISLKYDQKTLGRLRSQSENISFTFLSFMEKGIQRKLSKEFKEVQATS